MKETLKTIGISAAVSGAIAYAAGAYMLQRSPERIVAAMRQRSGDLIVPKGEPGRDGKDGKPGKDGAPGKDGFCTCPPQRRPNPVKGKK